ncbi:hypothetical protein SAMN04487859_12919 [Roseovarius lutimaris]|uniref:Relaxasome subunit MobC n=1 Tax=Roseovarius lutimaris TaxID=1005928 RepID=A0A1I5GEM2_9RHOB|nr:hypothetical protein [Roseovarius lutimaris]SFO34424.1 hypothetical protein SAMN04487859_12919 [Roseovarius lutimaris]
MSSIETQIAQVQKRIDQERARLKDLRARDGAQKRKRDTRRKIIFGYAFLEWLAARPADERRRLLTAVHAGLKDRERQDFPLDVTLKELAEADPSPETPERHDPTPCLPFE